MITGRLRPVIKLVLGFGFDFGNENQITCTRSNQHAFGNVMLCCENGCWEPILCVCGVLREKLFWVKIEKNKFCCCCHEENQFCPGVVAQRPDGSLATSWSPAFALGVEVLTCHRQVVAQRPLATPGT
ncbi:hypothetical protein P8452_77792 [Trifolium repens]|nr:hypothetical protein P8452_77792 [Trifolium repens]